MAKKKNPYPLRTQLEMARAQYRHAHRDLRAHVADFYEEQAIRRYSAAQVVLPHDNMGQELLRRRKKFQQKIEKLEQQLKRSKKGKE